MSTADRIGLMLGDGALCVAPGWDLHAILMALDATHETRPDVDRYSFTDGSAIISIGAGWDIEGEELWTWKGKTR